MTVRRPAAGKLLLANAPPRSGGGSSWACSARARARADHLLVPQVRRRRRSLGAQSAAATVAAAVRGRRRARRASRSGTPTAGSTTRSTPSSDARASSQARERAAAPAGRPEPVRRERERQAQGAARVPRRARGFPSDFTGLAAAVIARPAGAFAQDDRRRRRRRTTASRSRRTRSSPRTGSSGRVTRVCSRSARVTLLTDEQSAVSALDVATGAAGIVRHGQGVGSTLDPRPRPEGARASRSATRSSRPAGARRASRRSTRRASRSGASRASAQADTDLYKQVQVEPFADFDLARGRARARPRGPGQAVSRRRRPDRAASCSSRRSSRCRRSRRSRSLGARARTCCSSRSSRSRCCAARSGAGAGFPAGLLVD